jgi:hypothetical protein
MRVSSFKSVFSIPFAVPPLNATRNLHWAARMRIRNRIAEHLLAAGMTPSRFPWPGEKRKVKVTVQVYSLRTRDRDGNVAGCKPVFDSVVRLKWAVDDGPQWMEQVVPDAIRVKTRSECKTVVTVEGGPYD